MRKCFLFASLVFLAFTACKTDKVQKIDRNALVERNNPHVKEIEELSSLSVGNGNFAYTVDATGMQTFPEAYAAGVPLGTQSQWGWHSFPNPEKYRTEETLKNYNFRGWDEPYAVQFNELGRPKEAADYYRVNPHRLHLGNIGLELIKEDGSLAKTEDIKSIDQTLKLWDGVIDTKFTVNGDSVMVKTASHPQKDQIGIVVSSPLIAKSNGKTFQKVKRAAPGGEGYVMNHFSQKAVNNYLSTFTKAFSQSKALYPNSFFNDSYEVYGADWTLDLFEQFEKRRGYKLQDFLPEFLSEDKSEIKSRIISDYRETLGELLLENFTSQWTAWAHSHGSTTRNQAHGSPANLIDIYAGVDIPECESFGISDFHIKGLRVDTVRKINDSDLSMLKYASSAAHITGKPYVSSETFTWLTEHFRTSLSQLKPDLDLLFTSGVNHIFFHGTTYSPKEAEWPGWKFYASVDMSPTNSIWRDSQAFFDYVTRCQSFLQEGNPDSDFLLYFPIYDMWHNQDGRLLMFDIHKMQRRAPEFISAVHDIVGSGYDVDYISDKYLLSTKMSKGKLITSGGTSYKAIIVPGADIMPLGTLKHLFQLAEEGATVVFLDNYPKDIPGFFNLTQRKEELKEYEKTVLGSNDFKQTDIRIYGKGRIITGSDYSLTLQACGIQHEEIKSLYGLHYIRRANEDGYHYFVAALQEKDTEGWITLAVDAESIMLFNPLDGTSGLGQSRKQKGKTQVYLQLKSGESVIIKTFNKKLTNVPLWNYYEPEKTPLRLDSGWKVKFVESTPAISDEFVLNKLESWTELNKEDLKRNMGTALYSVEIDLPELKADDWQLTLGDVRESARIRINGQNITTLWSVPFKANVGKYLKQGKNLIEVEVTNLPANRIADYDRLKVEWRIFKEINFVKLNYIKGDFAGWDVIPSGLLGPVILTPLKTIK